MKEFKYVLPIHTMDSDEEIWYATSRSGEKITITNIRFDNMPLTTSEEWLRLLDCCPEEAADFYLPKIAKIFSGRDISYKITRVRVDADGTVTIEITDYSTGITAKHLVEYYLKPSFDIVVLDENGAPIEKYTINTSVGSTIVMEYPLNGGEPIDLESLVPKRYITLKSDEPDRCFVTEAN